MAPGPTSCYKIYTTASRVSNRSATVQSVRQLGFFASVRQSVRIKGISY
jgi:hypothetical protein